MLKQYTPIPDYIEKYATAVVDSAFCIHTSLGPGLLESVYEACLCYELRKREIPFKSKLSLPVTYHDLKLDAGLRLDVIIDGCLIVELKAVEKIIPVHEAQLLTYLKLTKNRLGLLINFNVDRIKDGIRRVVL